MGVQLVDGKVKYPMGMLEDITITICGVEISHTFVVVEFGQETI